MDIKERLKEEIFDTAKALIDVAVGFGIGLGLIAILYIFLGWGD